MAILPIQSAPGPEWLPPETRSYLRDLLRNHLGPTYEIEHYRVANRRHDYIVLVVQPAGVAPSMVVKLAGHEAPVSGDFERTAALHRLVRGRTTIPVPEVLAVDVSYDKWPWRYIIETYVAGEEWSTVYPRLQRSDLEHAHRQIGDAVAQLHSITFLGFGEISSDGVSRSDLPYITVLTERASSRIGGKANLELFLDLLGREANLFNNIQQACLCHEDLHKHNILFSHNASEWQLASILDFDSAWAGDYESDLARLELWRGMTGPGFWEAYLQLQPLKAEYEERRHIYQLLWCLEYAASTPEHLADTNRICAQLGLPAIDSFASLDE